MTKAIIDIAKPLGIAVHDHIIVGKSGHASLRGMRLIRDSNQVTRTRWATGYNLPVPWMALVIFGFTYLLAAAIFAAVAMAATGERAEIAEGDLAGHVAGARHHLRPVRRLHRVTGLGRQRPRQHRSEPRASSPRSAVPGRRLAERAGARLRGLVRDYVEQAVTVEWPMMAHQEASLKVTPPALAEALQLVVAMTPQGTGQGDRAAS